MSLSEVLKATGGQVQALPQNPIEFHGVGTDTRNNLSGQLFVALKGDAFDGHDFVAAAAAAGALAALVHQPVPSSPLMQIQVPDTLKAFQDLAHYWRKKNKFKVVGITGSNGKTTSKEFAAHLLEKHYRISYSKGSFNNHWGVPMSLLAAHPDCEIVIQEMGMNHLGELTTLARIAEPDISVVTMVGSAHIGELGSQANIAKAKEELYEAAAHGDLIFNLDNEWTMAMYQRATQKNQARKIWTYSSFSQACDVFFRIEDVRGFQLLVTGKIQGVSGRAIVPVVGRHNVVNLMAAASIALACGMTPEQIWQGLSRCRSAWGRNQVVHLKSGATVLFDGYNANPESMAALIKNLYEVENEGKKVVVLGGMMELGHQAAKAHQELGALVGRTQVDIVWYMGHHAADFEAGIKAEGFSKKLYISSGYEDSLAREVGSVLNRSDVAVIKGSRAMKMERVLEQWQPLDFSKK